MSWTHVFPVLDNQLLQDYATRSTPRDRRLLSAFTEVLELRNYQDKPHIVSVSINWMPASLPKNGVAPRIEDLRSTPEGVDLYRRFLKPVLNASRRLQKTGRDVCIRVYMSSELAFLVPKLVKAGCEVAIMKTSGRLGESSLWRFLALEERGRSVTITHATDAERFDHDIARTNAVEKSGLGFWRTPVGDDVDEEGYCSYKPIYSSQCGGAGAIRCESALLH